MNGPNSNTFEIRLTVISAFFFNECLQTNKTLTLYHVKVRKLLFLLAYTKDVKELIFLSIPRGNVESVTVKNLSLKNILLLNAHRQVSKKRCFEKYCSCDKACQFSAL